MQRSDLCLLFTSGPQKKIDTVRKDMSFFFGGGVLKQTVGMALLSQHPVLVNPHEGIGSGHGLHTKPVSDCSHNLQPQCWNLVGASVAAALVPLFS